MDDLANIKDSPEFLGAKYNPMQETVWSTPMVFAWLMWRTPEAVQEQMDAFRRDDPDCKPATLWEMSLYELVVEIDASLAWPEQFLSFEEAKKELWSRLRTGDLVATAMNNEGRSMEIPEP